MILGGCVQTTSNLSKPATPAPAAGNPLVLNGAPGEGGGPATAASLAPAEGEAAPALPPVASAPAPALAPASTPPPTPATTVTAAPQPAPAPEALPTTAPAAPARTADGYPNINAPPAEPGGTLLPPEERQRIIAELEALRAKQGGSAPGPANNAPAITNQAASHGDDALRQIEKCSQPGAADLYPECAPED